jgi:hypothetical protein
MSNRGVNNSNVLSGKKEHIIVVNKDDVDKIREYTKALGTTSLYDSISILSSLETSVSQKAKAIGDLILLRHILSGDIQFKEKRLFNLFQSVIGKDFIDIAKSWNDLPNINIKEKVEKLIVELDNNEQDIKVIAKPFRYYLKHIIEILGISFVGATAPPALAIMAYLSPEMAIRLLVILLIVFGAAHAHNKIEGKVLTIAVVKLIDRLLSTNKEIHEIINSPDSGSLIPEPLRNDPLGMALFFKYIKKINVAMRTAELQREISKIEKQTGTTVLSMNTFKRLNKPLDDCGICLKPLAAVLMGKPIEVCENHHMFHDKCIGKWLRNSKENLCPTCRQPILGSVKDRINYMNIPENKSDDVVPVIVNNGVVPRMVNNVVLPGMVNNVVLPVIVNNANNSVVPDFNNNNNGLVSEFNNNNNGLVPEFNNNNNGIVTEFLNNNNNGVAPGMVNNNNGVVRGGRKRRTLRYKKRKSTRKNMSRR